MRNRGKSDDIVKQLKEIFNKDISTESIKQTQNLVQQTVKELRERDKKAGEMAGIGREARAAISR